MKLLPMLAAGSFQHHATRRQPSMKSSTSPTINPFHRIRGWIVSPESRWPGRWLLLVAAAVLVVATHFLFGSFPAYAQSPDGVISGLTLASDEAQTLTITWDAASPMPKHYEVYWTYEPGGNGGYGNDLSSGRATTTGTSYTATELSGSSVYGVGVRARYEESWGPWSDEEELKVLWPYVSPFYIAHIVRSIIRPNAVFRGSVYTNHVPRDNDPSTLDLAVRVDVVDSAGRSWNYCEQEGMGMFQNRYIIDDLLEAFYFHYGSPSKGLYFWQLLYCLRRKTWHGIKTFGNSAICCDWRCCGRCRQTSGRDAHHNRHNVDRRDAHRRYLRPHYWYVT